MPENISDKNQEEKKDFYTRLKDELLKNTSWPTEYMYKFIIPNTDENLKKVKEKFGDKDVNIKKNYSKTGKYISLSIVTNEKDPESVINLYKSMEDIEGLIAL